VAPILLIFLRIKLTRVYACHFLYVYFPDRGCVHTLLTLYVYATECHYDCICLCHLCGQYTLMTVRPHSSVTCFWHINDWLIHWFVGRLIDICRRVIASRVFEKGHRVSCCTYDAKGQYIGMTDRKQCLLLLSQAYSADFLKCDSGFYSWASIIGWTGGRVPPTFRSMWDVMCFVPPPTFGGDLLNSDCLSTPIKHIIMLRSHPLGGELSTRETPALSDTERVLKEGGTKWTGWERIKGKRKTSQSPKFDSVIAPALAVWYSCTAYIDVCPLLFCLGRRPCFY